MNPVHITLHEITLALGVNMLAAVNNAKHYDWETWALGLLRSFTQGGAAAVSAGLVTMGIDHTKFNLTTGLSSTLGLMVAMFLLQGTVHMMQFLQTHGAPEAVSVTTEETISQTTTQQSGSSQPTTKTDLKTTQTTTTTSKVTGNGGTSTPLPPSGLTIIK